jgi:hypothetical protein
MCEESENDTQTGVWRHGEKLLKLSQWRHHVKKSDKKAVPVSSTRACLFVMVVLELNSIDGS